jgi:hypothetical protein
MNGEEEECMLDIGCKPERKRPRDNIAINLRYRIRGGTDWTDLAVEKDEWRNRR